MHFQTLAVVAAAASAQATYLGFNYGSTFTDGSAKAQSDFESEFNAAKQLAGTNSEFTSARLYTMIQATTVNTPIAAIPAAIKTQTSLLLGIWASAGEDTITNEIAALKAAISQYGSDFTNLIAGISVGSEDLYRNSVTGVSNKAGIGADPDVIVKYIKEVRSAISGTAASGAKIGHVDTWDAWTNGTNAEVIANVDWLGMDTYPYFQKTQANGIENSKKLFDDAYDVTSGAANGKEVWVTETGWPVSGDTSGQGIPSTDNAEKYWKETGCSLFGKVNTWWYILDDSLPTTPNPSFGIVTSLTGSPLHDLTCDASSSSTSSSSASSTGTASSSSTGTSGDVGSGSTTAASGMTTATQASGASVSPTAGPTNGTHTSGSPSASGTGTFTGAGNQVMYSSGALAVVFAALAYAF